MFSGQKRVKLIRSKLMTGICSINNFMHDRYFVEFLFKFRFASVKFSKFRLLFKCSFNGLSFITLLAYTFLSCINLVIVCLLSNHKYILSHLAFIYQTCRV